MTGQTAFAGALADATLPPPEGLHGPDGRPAGRRFDVYRNNVTVSLMEALGTGFPVLKKLLGEENFRHLSRLYIRDHLPASPLLMHYGQEMPVFLAGVGELSHLGYLPDVARLELAIRASYHATDSVPIDPARLTGLDDAALGRSTLRLAPAVHFIRSPWPLHAIWRFNTEPGGPKPEAVAQDVLIVRPGFDPRPLPLPNGGGAFVATIQSGKTLNEACEAASAETDSFDLAASLSLLLANGAITTLEETC